MGRDGVERVSWGVEVGNTVAEGRSEAGETTGGLEGGCERGRGEA